MLEAFRRILGAKGTNDKGIPEEVLPQSEEVSDSQSSRLKHPQNTVNKKRSQLREAVDEEDRWSSFITAGSGSNSDVEEIHSVKASMAASSDKEEGLISRDSSG